MEDNITRKDLEAISRKGYEYLLSTNGECKPDEIQLIVYTDKTLCIWPVDKAIPFSLLEAHGELYTLILNHVVGKRINGRIIR